MMQICPIWNFSDFVMFDKSVDKVVLDRCYARVDRATISKVVSCTYGCYSKQQCLDLFRVYLSSVLTGINVHSNPFFLVILPLLNWKP